MELKDFLDQQFDQSSNFVIDSEDKANWALRKLKDFRAHQLKNSELARSEIRKIELWLDEENEKLQKSIDHFENLMRQYMTWRSLTDNSRSLSLPAGRLRWRKQQPQLNYNEDQLIVKLQEMDRDDLLIVKQKVSKSALKKAFEIKNGRLVDPATGEVIDGVEVIERADALTIQIEDGSDDE